MNLYLIFKALHVVGFVSWFAGLFYLVRMFVYHAEADSKPELIRADWKAQFTLMQERVYAIIATPAMYITWFCGIGMIILNPALLQASWLQLKLVLLLLLVAYHFYCKKIITTQKNGLSTQSGESFRVLNEVPTLFLVAIAILAVAKDLVNFLYLFFGIVVFGIVLMVGIKTYKKKRHEKMETK